MIVKVPGIKKTLGDGKEYVIPPLNLRTLEQMSGALGSLRASDPTDSKSVTTIIDAAHSALTRNYPELTRDQVADMIDVGNMVEVIEAIMDVSGLRRKMGEEAAAKTLAPLTGAESTQKSQPEPDGLGNT